MGPLLPRETIVTLSPRIHSMISGFPGWLEKLLLLVLCWQFAGLFWLLFAPSTQDLKLVMPRQGPDRTSVSTDAFLRWYGGGSAADSTQDYSLVAVIAGRNGAAVLRRSDGSSVAIAVGDEISAANGARIGSGTRLLAVEPDQVTIERSGVRQLLKLPRKTSPALFADAAARPTLPTIRMTRGQMAGIFQGGNLGSWDKGLSSAPEGGIRVDNAAAQPLARMLQFKNGDIIKSINGRRLDQLADSSLLFHFFGQQAAVDVVVVRDGASLTQHYDIQP
jgi:general secretion pathway protein C